MCWRACLPILAALAVFLSLASKTPAYAGATCDLLAAQANQTFAQINNVPFNAPPGGVNITNNKTLGTGGDLAPGEVLIFQVIPGPNFAGVTNAISDVSVGLVINSNVVFQFRTKVATTREFTIPAGATFPATVLFAVLNFENAVTLSAELRLSCRNGTGGTGGTGTTTDGSGLTQIEKSQTAGSLTLSALELGAILDGAAFEHGKDKAFILLDPSNYQEDVFARIRRLEREYILIEFELKKAKDTPRNNNPWTVGYHETVELDEKIIKLESELKSIWEKILKARTEASGGLRPLTDDLLGVIAPAGFKISPSAGGQTPDIDIDLDRAFGLGEGLKFDLWFKSAAAFLNDGSSANRDGYALRFSLGGAYRLSDKFAISAQVSAGPGRIRIKTTNSQTKFHSYGLSLSGVLRFSDNFYGSVSGFVQRGNHNISFGPVTGSFDENTYGFSADVSGSYLVNAIHLEPFASARFRRSNRDSFTDSGGTPIAGGKSNFGRFSAGTKVGRGFEGEGIFSLVKPFMSGQLHYDFNSQKTFNIGQGITVSDNRFNAEVGAGVEAYLKGGVLGKLSVNYFGVGSGNIRVLSFNGSLNVPF